MTKHILIIGLSQAPPQSSDDAKAAAGSPSELRAKIMATVEKARSAGYELEVKQTEAADLPTTIVEMREKLQGRTWDGYVIGFGLRGLPEYSEAFEQLVNSARELAPKTKLGFNSSPADLMATIERMFR
jgi:cobyric acid synthase